MKPCRENYFKSTGNKKTFIKRIQREAQRTANKTRFENVTWKEKIYI